MKVYMILTNSFSPDIRVYKEAKYLAGLGIDVTILCWDRCKKTNLPKKEKKEGFLIVRFISPSKLGSGIKQLPAYFGFIKSCKNYIKQNPCDILHCHDLDGVIAGNIASTWKIPYVFDMHEFYETGHFVKKMMIRVMVKRFIRRSISTICVSSSMINDYYGNQKHKLLLLKNYPDSNIICSLQKTKSNVFRIGYHGTVRNQLQEFKALFEACKDMEDVRVDINGGGIDLDSLKVMAKNYKNVTVHGHYDGVLESNKLYQNTDVLFLGYSPENENYHGQFEPVKYFEAILTSTPIIATKALNIGIQIEKNMFGIAIDTRNPEEIKRAINIFKENSEFLSNCRENMRAMSPLYDWNEAVKILDKVYLKKEQKIL